MASGSNYWEAKLQDAFFAVGLADVYVGSTYRQAKRYRAVIPTFENVPGEPFVTDRYSLIRNEDAVDLGFEAFERVFGPGARGQVAVFNVVLARTRGSFFADFTSPSLHRDIPMSPQLDLGIVGEESPTLHKFFLRVVNSYNRTHAVRLEVGVCRSICRNGFIFGKQSIYFKDPHDKTKQQLMDEIAHRARELCTEALSREIGAAYVIRLGGSVSVLEGAWQTLRLAIPPVDPKARVAAQWRNRCTSLRDLAREYERGFGRTAFSVLQAASQWAREHADNSPIQRHSYERRCGEMLERLTAEASWPKTDDRTAPEQLERIERWASL